jgi:hypothetical protein
MEVLDEQDDPWGELNNRDADGEEAGGTWLLGLPTRLVHGVAASAVPLLAVGLLSI